VCPAILVMAALLATALFRRFQTSPSLSRLSYLLALPLLPLLPPFLRPLGPALQAATSGLREAGTRALSAAEQAARGAAAGARGEQGWPGFMPWGLSCNVLLVVGCQEGCCHLAGSGTHPFPQLAPTQTQTMQPHPPTPHLQARRWCACPSARSSLRPCHPAGAQVRWLSAMHPGIVGCTSAKLGFSDITALALPVDCTVQHALWDLMPASVLPSPRTQPSPCGIPCLCPLSLPVPAVPAASRCAGHHRRRPWCGRRFPGCGSRPAEGWGGAAGGAGWDGEGQGGRDEEKKVGFGEGRSRGSPQHIRLYCRWSTSTSYPHTDSRTRTPSHSH